MTALDLRPGAGEHSAYAVIYIDATAGALHAAHNPSVVALLEGQTHALRALVAGVDEAALRRAYAPGKWTLAESLLHVADSERVFSYRMVRIARGDQTPLPSFDQDAWVPLSGAGQRSLADILTEIEAVRGATLALVRSLRDTAVAAMGTASGNPVSVRGLAWMIAGHFAHHLEITRTRYLGGV